MGDNCSVYMQIKAAISQMAALLYLPMSSAILRLLASPPGPVLKKFAPFSENKLFRADFR